VKPRLKMLVSLAATMTLLASAAPSVRAQEDEGVPLSLSEALGKALENNLDLAIAKRDPEIAEHNVTFEKAAFDPILGAGVNHSASRQKSAQVFDFTVPPIEQQSEARFITDTVNASLTGRLFFGATYSVTALGDTTPGHSGTTTVDSLGAVVSQAEIDRAKAWRYRIDFTLPLLKGFGRAANEAGLLVAKRNLTASRNELQRQADATIKTVLDAYWDLRAVREAQKVAEQALKLAQELYDLNKKKVEVGTLAPIEITQAEANVASNVEGTIRAKVAVKNAEDNLRRLLAIPSSDPLWSTTILPTEKPQDEAVSIDQEQAMTTAMERRPEVANAKEAVEISKINSSAAHNGAMHQLDVVTSWARSHSENPETVTVNTPPVFAGTYPFDPISRTSPDWAIGLVYTYPIGNRAAKSNYAIAKINAEKSQTSLDSVLQDVRVDVRTAVRAVESGFERVTAARKNVELQTKKLDAEQKKFDNGMSTSFEVFTFQTDLRNAQLSLIQALLDYNKSLADLERAKGTLLESQGLKLADNAGR